MKIDRELYINAIRTNNAEQIKQFAHADFQDDEYLSLAEMIIEYGNAWHMDILKNEGYDFVCADCLGCSLLEAASLTGKIDIVRWLIESNLNIIRFRYEFCHACEHNYIEIVKLLLENGYKAFDIDESGRNGLHWCAQENYIELCFLLIENGAAIDQMDRDGITPLYQAAGDNNIEIAKMLLENHAKTEVTGCSATPFMIGCLQHSFEICDLLIKFGADINATDDENRTTLLRSAIKGDRECIEYLLSKNADMSVVDCHGYDYTQVDGDKELQARLYKEEFGDG